MGAPAASDSSLQCPVPRPVRPTPSAPPVPPQSLAAAPLGDAARDAVVRRLASQAHRWPDLGLEPLDTGSLSALDAAFAHAVYSAAVRRWLTLACVLGHCLRPRFADLEPRLQAVLLAGSAQLLLLDRVPAHAAINHAVEWAKQRVRPGAGAMANAVLRKLAALQGPNPPRRERWTGRRDEIPLADGSALAFTRDVLPEPELPRLAAATSTPVPLLGAWSRDVAPTEVQRLALHGLAEPPIILNTAHASVPLPPTSLRPHEAPGHHVFTGSFTELTSLLSARSDVWVQDPASALAVAGVADLRPALVLDLCAGQGTKTRQLAAVFPEAKIVATDVDAARLATLRDVFKGHPRVLAVEPGEIREFKGRADLVLLDVPCSNTGVLARRPEAKYRYSPEHTSSLVALQQGILADALPCLSRESGTSAILYSTCSLEADENEAQTGWVKAHHGLRPGRENRRAPGGGPGQDPEHYTDGSYSVVLS